ncbi:MAG: cytidine deaminase [Thermoleophilia bacterium]|nr:cytidine deaminase [Thermoleophilia bacterium]
MSTGFAIAGDVEVELRELAREASTRAYVPYSKFHVGAALRYPDGSVVTGCNVENAAYGVTVCAERTALVRSIAEGRDTHEITHIAVHVDGPEGSPCGMCRQTLVELAPNATITFLHEGRYVSGPVMSLLPAAFLPGALEL